MLDAIVACCCSHPIIGFSRDLGETLLINRSVLSVSTTEPLASVAAEWLRAFYPAIEIENRGENIVLSSDSRARDELEVVWKCALANERLHAMNAAPRAYALAELMQ